MPGPTREGTGLNNEEYQKLIDEHGGIVGTQKVDPYIVDPVTGLKDENYNPAYKVTFADGTMLTVRAQATYDEQTNTWDTYAWSIEDPGTAYAPKRTPTDDLEPVVDPRTGEKIGLRDPKSGQVITLPKEAGPKNPWSTPQRAPDGTIYQVNEETGEIRKSGNVGATGTAPRSPSPLPANTSARYIAVMMPDGTIQYQENKNWIPPEQTKAAWISSTPTTRFLLRQNADGEIEQVENPNYMDPETDPQIQWAKKQQAWDNAYKQLTAQINAQNNLQSQWNEMVPRAAMPGQVYYSGYEPNGIMSQIFGNMGMGYNPENYRAPILQFDPNASWQQAQALIAQQQGGR